MGKDEKAEVAVEESNLPESFDAELESALDEMEASNPEKKEPEKEEAPKDLPEDEDPPSDEAPVEEAQPEPEKGEEKPDDSNAISDELVERAVRAGLSMKDIKGFANADVLELVCFRLEGAKADEGGDGGSESTSPTMPDIPDLDPEEYDENIVAGFSAMKEFMKSQQEVINQLTEAGKAAAEKQAEIEAERERIEAERKEAEQKAALAKRSTQHISRPSGDKTSPKADPFDEVADEIDKKFFKN